MYAGLDQIRGMGFGPARNGGEAYVVASGGGVVVYKRTGGGTGLQEVARTRNKDVPTRTISCGCKDDRRGVGDGRDGRDGL